MLLGNVLMLMIIGISLYLEYHLGFSRTFLMLFFYSFFIIVVAKKYFQFFEWAASVGCLAFFISIFFIIGEGGKNLSQYLAAQQNILTISVKEIANFPDQQIFKFSDGYVVESLTTYSYDQSTIYSRTGGGPTKIHSALAVAPLVYPGWDATKDSVPAWVFCHTAWDDGGTNKIADCVNKWHEPYRVGRLVGVTHQHEIAQAIVDAEQNYKIKNSSVSPVLEWVQNIDKDIIAKVGVFLVLGAMGFMGWNLTLLKHYFISPVLYVDK